MNRLAALTVLLASLALAGGGEGATVPYTCEGGTRVQATYTGQHVRLVVNGRALEMDTQPSGSGARYVGGGHTWWTKGPAADLYRGEDPATMVSLDSCRES